MTTTDFRLSARRPGWVEDALSAVRRDGYAIVEDVLGADLLERTRAAMYAVQRRIVADVGPERLERAGELGVLRLMVAYDESFCRLLELEEVLAIVDRTVSPRRSSTSRTA